MALLFDATTEELDFGTLPAGIAGLAKTTCMVICRPTTIDTTGRRVLTTDDPGGGDSAFELRHRNNNWTFAQGTYATEGAFCESNDTPITVDTWCIVFGVDGGLTVAPVLYVADLGGVLAEVGGYGTQTTPVGAQTDDSGYDLAIGYRPDNTAHNFVGDVARVAIFDGALTLAQCKQVYNDVLSGHRHGMKFWCEVGYTGTGTQVDLADPAVVATGTVTGATHALHAPIMPPMWRRNNSLIELVDQPGMTPPSRRHWQQILQH